MVIKKIKGSYQSLDNLVSKIGDVIPTRFKFELFPGEQNGLRERHKILQEVFKKHKPPIIIGEHLGTGGFADVFAATSDYSGVKDFAVKILRKELLEIRKGPRFNRDEEEMRVKEVKQRFKNESYVQWDLSKNVSENIANSVVHVYDHGEFDSKFEFRFILMERMDMTLRDYISAEAIACADPKQLLCRVHLMVKIAEKISNVHHEGIFHRDIKPENILFPRGKSPRNICCTCGENKECTLDVKIADFGTVRWIKSYTDKYDAVIIGSQFYMSPEQIFNPATIDKRTDIYSFGVVCYELFYGEHPKKLNEHTTNLLEKTAFEKPFDRRAPQGFGDLNDIIYKCMNERHLRYQSMEEVLNELKTFLISKYNETVL